MLEISGFKERAGLRLSSRTVDQYVESARRFDEWLEEEGVDLPEDRKEVEKVVDDFLGHLKSDEGLRHSSIARHLAGVKAYFRVMHREDLNVEPPRVERKSLVEGEDYPAPKDVQRMIRETGDSRNKAILAILFSTGCRRGELVDLKKRDFNPPHLTISREKTRGKPERHPRKLDPTTIKIIQNYLDSRGDDSKALIATKGKPGRMTPENVYRLVREATEKKLGRAFTPHALRHARASQMIRARYPIKFVADYLGITVRTADEIYSHLTGREMDEAPPALEG